MTSHSENLRGAGLMALAMTCFALNDTSVKLVAQDLPLMQVILMRGIVACALVGIIAWRRGGLTFRGVSGRDWGLMLLRGLVEAGAAWTFLTALLSMPLADLTAILQALPLAVTLGAALVFGEQVGWRRWAAIGAGFLGVLLIVRPGTDVFSAASALGVATVALSATRDLVTRRLSPGVPTLLVSLVSMGIVACMGALLMLGQDWGRPTAGASGLICLSALFVTAAILSVVTAMRLGDVGFVAPFRYTGLLAAMVAGLVVFGEFPDALTLTGAAIVVGSGVFSFWRERRIGIARPRVPPR
ncbi:DMT family transporter [Wenxinia marina]|uniref:Permease of the drug/metabolite transporter (DMT) superfamily n=1 Tax=Wenxinia marina DSM 24838 TaxID=1123501 RepID=A0A0D0NGT3_9RHOB|nr:DMT family transporter [Wenxinia marina]KIQ67540.1 Permease of the drug/metabolite transporter (DMT) superfamily [Wenxinia marina DSM 24838]GGL68637.1 membrane protein [Wenxinia marina]